MAFIGDNCGRGVAGPRNQNPKDQGFMILLVGATANNRHTIPIINLINLCLGMARRVAYVKSATGYS